jgi:3'-phosphoadenosine 5'-phosphosulfate sulfotransferase (PAPS reductase)/FAD synthetase
MQTIEMFTHDEVRPTLEQRVEQALAALRTLFEENRMVVCQFSAGKDSGVVAALALEAARQHAASGGKPLVCVVTVDTLVESPEMVAHARRELAKMSAWQCADRDALAGSFLAGDNPERSRIAKLRGD